MFTAKLTESKEISYTLPVPTHAQFPPLSMSPAKVVHFLQSVNPQ